MTRKKDGHALVVGGTGMLAWVSLALARAYRVVSVVARRKERLEALAARSAREDSLGVGNQDSPRLQAGLVNPLALDYRDSRALEEALRDVATRHGPMELAVCWIHSTAPDALEVVARAVGSPKQPCRLFHVRGSAAADPSRPRPELRAALEAVGSVRYREVILGFVIEDWGSRWLTHEEISGGVLEAVRSDTPQHIIGTVRPWSARP